MNVLVTGGASYIGSILVEELVQQGTQVVVLDNLSQGHQQALEPEAKFIHVELGDLEKLSQIFSSYNIQAVMHLAAQSVVGQSMVEP
jgi:UDP-glucose 4-epimerase